MHQALGLSQSRTSLGFIRRMNLGREVHIHRRQAPAERQKGLTLAVGSWGDIGDMGHVGRSLMYSVEPVDPSGMRVSGWGSVGVGWGRWACFVLCALFGPRHPVSTAADPPDEQVTVDLAFVLSSIYLCAPATHLAARFESIAPILVPILHRSTWIVCQPSRQP